MFHFQLVVLKLDISYPELRPHLHIGFGDMQTQLPLPELSTGTNPLGIGKSLTAEISDMEIADWFQQYALCLEFTGSLLKKPLTAFLSLQNFESDDEIKDQVVTMDNEQAPGIDVKLCLSLKFKYVRQAVARKQPIPRAATATHTPSAQMEVTMAKPAKSSFLYGKGEATKTKTASAFAKKQPARPSSTNGHKVKPQSVSVIKPQLSNQQPYISEYECQQELHQEEFQGVTYYCPPVMEFTNTPASEAEPVRMQQPDPQMENYSFQNNSLPARQSDSKPKSKAPTGKAFSKASIRQLVEEQYGHDNNIVVPILEQGRYVFRKLNEVSKDQLNAFLQNPVSHDSLTTPAKKHFNMVQPQHKPQEGPHQIKHSQSAVPLPQGGEQSKINTSLSAQYPQDFESVSIGHSHISREQSSLSKAGRKREEIAEEQSISEIYSDNFESFSQSHVSRSNVKRSLEEIGESIRSSMGHSYSHSQKK